MQRFIRHLALAGLCAAATLAQAGQVEVAFDPNATFSDAGSSVAQRQQHLETLAAHLRTLGERRLGADQTLRVEFVDLDLAGTMRLIRRLPGELRVVRGGADTPRIELRYTLSEAGRVLASGSESLTDLGYAARGGDWSNRRDDPLRHEKRLLDDWFSAHFGAKQH